MGSWSFYTILHYSVLLKRVPERPERKGENENLAEGRGISVRPLRSQLKPSHGLLGATRGEAKCRIWRNVNKTLNNQAESVYLCTLDAEYIKRYDSSAPHSPADLIYFKRDLSVFSVPAFHPAGYLRQTAISGHGLLVLKGLECFLFWWLVLLDCPVCMQQR